MFKVLQKVGKAFILPIAILPAAGQKKKKKTTLSSFNPILVNLYSTLGGTSG